MQRRNDQIGPIWLWGILLALALILLTTRGQVVPDNPALEQTFVRQTENLGDVQLPNLSLGNLPADLQQLARDIQQQLGVQGSAPVLQPVAENSRLRIEINELQATADGVQVIGEVSNIGDTPVEVPVSAFEFTDSYGAVYSADSNSSARLEPGERTALDLAVPLPPDSGLLLTLRLPPDPPLEQMLLAGA